MSHLRIPNTSRSLATTGAWLLVSALLLTGCGLGGDDSDALTTPTPSANATVSAGEPTGDASAPGTPTPRTGSMGLADPDSSPGATLAASPGANDRNSTPTATSTSGKNSDGAPTGSTPGTVVNADSTPETENVTTAGNLTPAADAATTEADTATSDPGSSSSTNDGTSGATPSANAGTPRADEATPDAATADTVVVDSCKPDNVPEFSGDSPDFVVTTDLNFRVGPGSDCDLIDDQVLATGTGVTVISDPVERDGDEALWVQISVGDQEGWVAADYIDEAP